MLSDGGKMGVSSSSQRKCTRTIPLAQKLPPEGTVTSAPAAVIAAMPLRHLSSTRTAAAVRERQSSAREMINLARA